MSTLLSIKSDIAIVGAGIGGLTIALALADKGAINLKVYERRDSLSDLGAALQIGPNAARILASLGLANQLESVADRSAYGEMFEGVGGQKLATLPLDAHSYRSYGAHSYQLLRADLYELLWSKLKEVLGWDPVVFSKKTVDVRQENGATLCFSDGDEVKADVVLGADGVDSVVRSTLFDSSQAEYSGYFAWRGLLDTDQLAQQKPLQSLRVWVGSKRHLIAYPVSGGSKINLVGIVESEDWRHENTVETSAPGDWLNDYPDWDNAALELVSALPECHKWSLRTMQPLSCFGTGSVGMLGDAAHPMLPSLAQGAAQAIEDALVLAELISSGSYSPAELWQDYYKKRSVRVKRVQDASLWNLKFFHRQGSAFSRLQNAGMRLGSGLTTEIIGRKYRWLYSD